LIAIAGSLRRVARALAIAALRGPLHRSGTPTGSPLRRSPPARDENSDHCGTSPPSSPFAESPGPRKRHARELFAGLPRRYDHAGAALSFGQDPRWRAALVEALAARPGERVLDVATGTGMVAAALVRRYGVTVVGLDQSPEMLGAAHARLARDPVLAAAITLVEGEAERLPFADGEFDHLTFTYLLRYVEDPQATLRELARVVAPGGRVAMLEFGVPAGEPWRVLWRVYTRVGLPLAGRAIAPDWAAVGRFLARSIPDFYARHPAASLPQMWRDAGIGAVQMRTMSLGAGLVMWGTREGASGLGD
jgi:demethylmenaquinone methyltransferase/2-methoxy-6-polyprenyl-1,4-benzoquinol methylase